MGSLAYWFKPSGRAVQIEGPIAQDKEEFYGSHADYFNDHRGESRSNGSLEPAKRAMENGWVRVREYDSAWHIQGFNLRLKGPKLRKIMDYLACAHPSSVMKTVNILSLKVGYYSNTGQEWDDRCEQRQLPHL